ncbi:hypothetical protein E2C01_030948 [Portunus trituberculatus]|uniref:Uncharacterized protein n=1 Tax=Portunus trituberculatus TaxID=210409 RepID=A0A5B7EWR7_PORTR|nr:hypothetical protein [Portunus trituberculatus]
MPWHPVDPYVVPLCNKALEVPKDAANKVHVMLLLLLLHTLLSGSFTIMTSTSTGDGCHGSQHGIALSWSIRSFVEQWVNVDEGIDSFSDPSQSHVSGKEVLALKQAQIGVHC